MFLSTKTSKFTLGGLVLVRVQVVQHGQQQWEHEPQQHDHVQRHAQLHARLHVRFHVQLHVQLHVRLHARLHVHRWGLLHR